MSEVNFDFSAAERAARQIEELRNQMKHNIIPEYEEILGMVLHAWDGEAGKAFHDGMGRELSRMEDADRLLKEAESSAKEAICRAKQTEEKAKEIAQIRTY